ncbi:hypothetical protein, partial [Bacillus mycoides]|uniref:hypothetical protein n=1 Tax=Bacillus mycoides TaxID=1405 RepID=UPI00273A5E38
ERESEMTGDSSRWSWIPLKAEAARSESLFSIDWSHLIIHKIISIATHDISTFRQRISLYQQITTIIALPSTTFINILQSLLC